MDRRIDLDGCHNFRDLGGYPTRDGRRLRWRRLFRSDGLHLLSGTDVARLRDELALADVIDLRSGVEVEREGDGRLADCGARLHHIPLFDGDVGQARDQGASADLTLGDRYLLLMDFAAERIGRVLTTLARGGGPAVYHCAAGKDRTGVISAVILGVLGVEDEVIVADYAATAERLDAIVDRLMSLEGYRQMLAALPADTLHAEPETMRGLLREVGGRWGSMVEYARAAGVSPEDLESLRHRVLEPGPGLA